MKRYSFFLALATMLVLSFGLANGASVSLSNVETGYSGPDTVATNRAIVWTFNMTNSTGLQVTAILNGLVVYASPESSVTWAPIFLDTLDISGTGAGWKTRFDFIIGIYPNPAFHPPTTGMGRDTVAIGAANNEGPGFEDGFNSDVVTVTIPFPGIPEEFDGGTICIDSTTYDHGAENEWVWVTTGGGSVTPSWDGPHCYTIYDVPNLGPEIDDSTCQASLDFDHTLVATHQFTATDPDTLGARPLTFIQNSGPGSTTLQGMWSYAPTDADVGGSFTLSVSAQDDPGNLGPACETSLNFTNDTLVFNLPPGFTLTTPEDAAAVGKGNTYTIDFGPADQADGEAVHWFVGGVDPTPAGGGAAFGFDNSRSSSLFFFITQEADGGNLYTFSICLTDDIDTLCFDYHIEVLIVEPYEVVIEETNNTVQGGHELVCVTLEKGSEQLWGFDFLIAYDASVLSFQTALEGADLYAGCGWEYFNYRFGANGNCGNACPSGQLRVVGIAETSNGAAHPSCYLPASFPAEMFCLDFLVTPDQTFECQYVPIRFYWYDCGDNTISFNPSEDPTGFEQNLAISRRVLDSDLIGDISNPDVGYPTAQGAQDVDCFPEDADPSYPTPVRFIDFLNGGIKIVCVDANNSRGDINLNTVANEVADAVLFTNYFIYGIGVFNINTAAQIAATDVNADGLTLSVADLVYLIRIVLGDAQAFPKPVPVEAIYVNVKGILEVDIEVGAAALQLQGDVEPTLLADNMDMEYAFDKANNVTRVLVYSDPNGEVGRSFIGEFINTYGSAVVSIEMATYDGTPIIAKEVELPTVFALNQNYPNPFNPSTSISFALPTASDYTLTIYNVTGQKVYEVSKSADAGFVTELWDASSQASGVYFYRVVADSKDGQFKETKKMVLLK
ncbi:MAG: T9SS type A sorting domain-containing protein [candidate division Zixibacteria bacterium]